MKPSWSETSPYQMTADLHQNMQRKIQSNALPRVHNEDKHCLVYDIIIIKEPMANEPHKSRGERSSMVNAGKGSNQLFSSTSQV